MNPLSTIQPRTIIVVTIVVAALMMLSAIVELHQSREELYGLMESQAASLIEAIEQSGANALRSTDLAEELLAQRLADNARLVARYDSMTQLTPRILGEIASEVGLYRINVFDGSGRLEMTNRTTPHRLSGTPRFSAPDALQPLLTGKTNLLVLGVHRGFVDDSLRYAVAVRRTRTGGGGSSWSIPMLPRW